MLLKKVGLGRKGQAMVEYALLVTCIAVVGAVATSMLGHKTAETLAIAAAILPGAHSEDDAPISDGGAVIPTRIGPNGAIILNTSALVNTDRWAPVLGAGGGEILVIDN